MPMFICLKSKSLSEILLHFAMAILVFLNVYILATRKSYYINEVLFSRSNCALFVYSTKIFNSSVRDNEKSYLLEDTRQIAKTSNSFICMHCPIKIK